MDVTFIVGNGFDKALGLQTGYSDFYVWLKQKEHSIENATVKILVQSINVETDYWKDLEEYIGKEVINTIINDENRLENKITAFHDEITRLLVEYLKSLYPDPDPDQNTNDIGSASVKKFFSENNKNCELCWQMISSFLRVCRFKYPNSFFNNEYTIHPISLNYTSSLDAIVNKMKEMKGWEDKKNNTSNNSDITIKFDDKVLHPHGTLSSENIVLGVYDIEQIEHPATKTNPSYFERLIKSGYTKDYKECTDRIKNSSIICLYGVSLGKTDKKCWKTIGESLKADNKKQLFIFWYNNNDCLCQENEIKDLFLNHLNYPKNDRSKLKKQIRVIFHNRELLFRLNNYQIKLNENEETKKTYNMIYIQPGQFQRQNGSCYGLHSVKISYEYWLGEYAVTIDFWKAVMEKAKSMYETSSDENFKRDYEQIKEKSVGQNDYGYKVIWEENTPDSQVKWEENTPMCGVTWKEANIFCKILNAVHGEVKISDKKYIFSLPTEAQWEYACRAGNTEMQSIKYSTKIRDVPDLSEKAIFGGYLICSNEKFNFDENNFLKTKFKTNDKNNIITINNKTKPNSWGLYDMQGNVWEWCLDFYQEYEDDNIKDPYYPPLLNSMILPLMITMLNVVDVG